MLVLTTAALAALGCKQVLGLDDLEVVGSTANGGGTAGSAGSAGSGAQAGSGGGSGGEGGEGGEGGGGGTGGLGDAVARFPWNGYATGSARVTAAQSTRKPLRPRFAWNAVSGGSGIYYELEVDDSCDPSDFLSCDFSSPEISESDLEETEFEPTTNLTVANAAPVGTRYYWRVRACDTEGCSAWSAVRYLNVGRSTVDFDGDGWDEVAAHSGYDAYVWELGGPSVLYRTYDPGGSYMDSIAAIGDVNRDGYADLAISVSPYSSQGRIAVFYGAEAGIGATPSLTIEPPQQPAYGFAGELVRLGDVNADGYDDLAAAENHEGTSELANIHVYYGASGGLPSSPDLVIPGITTPTKFGRSMAGGVDLNGDGYPDLVVGDYLASNPEGSEGNAYVYYGSASGFETTPDQVIDNPDDAAGAGFANVWTGDMNGDGYGDLLVGAPSHSEPETHEGQAYLFLGSQSGLADTPAVTIPSPNDEEDGGFGTRAVVADFNLDGRDDAAFGISNANNARGEVYVYFGTDSGMSDSPDWTQEDNNPVDNGRFGGLLSAAYHTGSSGDRYLVVTANETEYTQDAVVRIYRSSFSGLTGGVILPEPDPAVGSYNDVAQP